MSEPARTRCRSVSRRQIPGRPSYLPPPPFEGVAASSSSLSSSYATSTSTTLPSTPVSAGSGATAPSTPASSSLSAASFSRDPSGGSATPSPNVSSATSSATFFRGRSLTNEAGTHEPGRRFTRVLIKEGRLVDANDAFDFSALESVQSLALMDAFKKGKISKDQTAQFGMQLSSANRSGNKAYSDHLLAMLGSLPERPDAQQQQHLQRRANTMSAADRSLPTHVMERLDNVQRLAILSSVKLGHVSVDEALKLVQEHYEAEVNALTPEQKAAEDDLENVFALMEKSSRMDTQRSPLPTPGASGGGGGAGAGAGAGGLLLSSSSATSTPTAGGKGAVDGGGGGGTPGLTAGATRILVGGGIRSSGESASSGGAGSSGNGDADGDNWASFSPPSTPSGSRGSWAAATVGGAAGAGAASGSRSADAAAIWPGEDAQPVPPPRASRGKHSAPASFAQS